MNQLPTELFMSIINVLLALIGSISAFLLYTISKKLDTALAQNAVNSQDIAVIKAALCTKQDKSDCYAFHKKFNVD